MKPKPDLGAFYAIRPGDRLGPFSRSQGPHGTIYSVKAFTHMHRVSTAPGNLLEFDIPPGNIVKFNRSSWKIFMTRQRSFLHRVGLIAG